MATDSVTRSDGRKMTPAGFANRQAADRARRRALGRLLAKYRSEANQLMPPGQRGSWKMQGPAARVIASRHPRVYRKLLAEERAKEQIVPLPRGRTANRA